MMWHVTYHFEVAGIQHEGSDILWGRLPEALQLQSRRDDSPSIANSVTVYYDPNDVTWNTLKKPTTSGWFWGLAIFAGNLFVSVCLLYLFIKIRSVGYHLPKRKIETTHP
jgi:hypothetical protein